MIIEIWNSVHLPDDPTIHYPLCILFSFIIMHALLLYYCAQFYTIKYTLLRAMGMFFTYYSYFPGCLRPWTLIMVFSNWKSGEYGGR